MRKTDKIGLRSPESTPDSRRDQSTTVSRREQWGKTSQDESAFLVALWKFREGCTLALVCRCTGNAASRGHLSCTWVNPSPYCSFVLCSFSPAPSVVFLVAIKKCVIPLSEPLDESPAKIELLQEVDVSWGRRGIITVVSVFRCNLQCGWILLLLFFLTHIVYQRHLLDIMHLMDRHEFSCSLVHLLKFFPCPLQEWSPVSNNGNSSCVNPFD